MWNLTGNAEGDSGEVAIHATDVTNVSRILLMGLKILEWDEDIYRKIGTPMSALSEIRSSVDDFGRVRAHGPPAGWSITGILGDQRATMFGQGHPNEGGTKNIYDTGLFILMDTDENPK